MGRPVTGIFITYRRKDSAPAAGRLRDRLAADLGEDRIFFDIDSIDLGQNFRDVVASVLESCSVVLVVIGSSWLSHDESGKRRIDDDTDVHRVEIVTALRSDVRVIPLLVDGASMPAIAELPVDLKDLASRNALSITHDSFSRDVEVLERAIRRVDESTVVPVERTPTSEQPAVKQPERQPGSAAAPKRRRSIVLLGLVAAASVVALLVAAWLVIRPGDDRVASLSSSTEPASNVTLPAAPLVFGHPVDEVVRLLGAAGLAVRQDVSGCSESTDPGAVREVTVGHELGKGIIFGKESDSVDASAASSLKPGDEVTVWTPTKRGC